MVNVSYSQDAFFEGVEIILDQINKSKIKYDYIFALVRGGLILGTHLSYALKVPLIAVRPSLAEQDLPLRFKRPLIVDDIIDTGETIRNVENHVKLGGVFTVDKAVLIENIAQPTRSQYCHRTIDKSVDSSWIDFYWAPNDQPIVA